MIERIDSRLYRVSVWCDLNITTFKECVDVYKKKFLSMPSSICVPTYNVKNAYDILTDQKINFMNVIAIPNMPSDSWMIVGEHAVIYADGA